jgi:hypothetical protein
MNFGQILDKVDFFYPVQLHHCHCTEVWELIGLSLPLYLQDVARNIKLLRKCKVDAQVDTLD